MPETRKTSKPKSPKERNKTPTSTEEWQQELLDKINTLTEKLEDLHEALLNVTQENEDLKSTVQKQAKEIAELNNNLNEREQYARNWSMRCLNISVPSDSESDTRVVMQCVYDSLIYPILEGAQSAGAITTVPSCDALLETAHILPGKNGAKPVIARFYSRYWRNLIFRHRRDFAPREQAAAAAAATGDSTRNTKTRMKFPFFEDLTRASFSKLNYIKQQQDVASAWTVNGSIRFKIKNSEQVYKVSNLSETFEDIVNK